MLKIALTCTILLISAYAQAQIVSSDGKYWLENSYGQPIAMYEGMEYSKNEFDTLPRTPKGLVWLKMGAASAETDRYVLVSTDDPRNANPDWFELISFLDFMRTPYAEYTSAQQTKMIADGLVDHNFSRTDAKKIAQRLMDKRNKFTDSDVIIERVLKEKRCRKILSKK